MQKANEIKRCRILARNISSTGIWLPQHRSDDTTSTNAGKFVRRESTRAPGRAGTMPVARLSGQCTRYKGVRATLNLSTLIHVAQSSRGYRYRVPGTTLYEREDVLTNATQPLASTHVYRPASTIDSETFRSWDRWLEDEL